MKTLAFLSQKGGSGKTTLAVHAAVAAQEAGQRVLLVDTDPQRTAAAWRDARAGLAPAVMAASASGLGRIIAKARDAAAIDLLVVDTAPAANPDAILVAERADFALIPCRPTAFDLSAIRATVAMVRAARVPAAFVLSACPFRAPEITEARAALAEHGLPVAPAMITDRRAFSRAVATGRAVTEFDGKGRAADEIRALWAWVEEIIHEPERGRDRGVRAAKDTPTGARGAFARAKGNRRGDATAQAT